MLVAPRSSRHRRLLWREKMCIMLRRTRIPETTGRSPEHPEIMLRDRRRDGILRLSKAGILDRSRTGSSRTFGAAGSGGTAGCGECHNQLLSGRRRRIFRQPDSLDRGTGRNGQHLRDPQRTGICLLEDFRSGGSSVCGRVRGDYRLFGFLKTGLRCGDFPGLCIGLFRIRLGWISRV